MSPRDTANSCSWQYVPGREATTMGRAATYRHRYVYTTDHASRPTRTSSVVPSARFQALDRVDLCVGIAPLHSYWLAWRQHRFPDSAGPHAPCHYCTVASCAATQASPAAGARSKEKTSATACADCETGTPRHSFWGRQSDCSECGAATVRSGPDERSVPCDGNRYAGKRDAEKQGWRCA